MLPVGSFIKVILSGIYPNLVRILFHRDRVTSLEIRKAVLTGKVSELVTVNEFGCLGCGACANTCPTQAIEMIPFEPAIEIVPGFIKNKVPKIDSMKCIYCLYCHDVCSVFAISGLPATIHPREVANPNEIEGFTIDPREALKQPFKIPGARLAELAKLLAEEAAPLLKERRPR